jgi:type I restriction enzyme, R subunit
LAPVGSKTAPEAKARDHIDHLLAQAGWIVQARDEMNLSAGLGVAVAEFPLKKGHGYADYLLFLDSKPVGVVEAKPVGTTLTGVEPQAKKYVEGIPPELGPPLSPLPFAYMSTGVITKFINHLDPHPRSRRVFNFARPEAMQEWLHTETLQEWLKSSGGFFTSAEDTKPSTLRSRLQAMPPVERGGLWPNQLRAIEGLEQSLKQDKPRALIQMATGSGKSLLAVSSLYRLIKFGGARRVLFLVDRANLGEQAEKEFRSYRTPDDHKKFDELYNVQRLTTNTVGSASKVVISTVQRLYSVLKGEVDFDPEVEEHSGYEEDLAPVAPGMPREPLPVVYNQALPPEFFDVVVIDECHRSIYSLWRQVIEYFDGYLIGLTATPAKHTFGFFNQNLVMEYPHEKAVADGVNCDFEVYKIRTKITAQGSTIEAEPGAVVEYRDRRTRKPRWETPDEDFSYTGADLDRTVVAKDQIRLIMQTLRDKVLKETFPDRTEVPKTLIFAKDDAHAEDIIHAVREEFGRGNEFATKITYKVTGGKKPRDLIQDFRNSYYPRIAVTVDLVATGTDIKPVEIVMFMRSVKSRLLYEQMKGRGVRVIKADELRAVTPDAKSKTHFLIVDCVGVTESKLSDTKPLDTKKGVSLKGLLEHVAAGGTHPDFLTSLASRLARIEKQCGPDDRSKIEEASGGRSLGDLAGDLLEALDPDVRADRARSLCGLTPEQEPTDEQVQKAAEPLVKEATKLLATTPPLRKLILDLRQKFEQVIDDVSKDELLASETGVTPEAKEKAQALVQSFEEYLAEHKDEIEALQFFYSVPHKERLRYADIKGLASAISSPPRSWTPEKLWRAYEALDRTKVQGGSAERLLTDMVSLVRFALHQEDHLVPYGERVRGRFQNWIAQQQNKGKVFTDEQRRWLDMMKDHIATSLEIEVDDFEYTPFTEEGGLARASQVFGAELAEVLRELNKVLAA